MVLKNFRASDFKQMSDEPQAEPQASRRAKKRTPVAAKVEDQSPQEQQTDNED